MKTNWKSPHWANQHQKQHHNLKDPLITFFLKDSGSKY